MILATVKMILVAIVRATARARAVQQREGEKNLTVNPIKLETGLRPNGAGIPYTLLLRIEAMRFPTFGLLL